MKSLFVPVLALAVAVTAPLLTPVDVLAADAPAGPKAASKEETDAVVNKVQAFYDQSKTFRSTFEQSFTSKVHRDLGEKKSSGTVLFAKPGKMVWTYKNPDGNKVVSNGSLLRVYEKANNQMYEQQVDKSQYPAALSFLTGGGKLPETFNFELFKGEDMNFKGGVVLVGVPKQPNPAYAKILFYVDSATSQVRRVMIIDGQGNRNRFDFLRPEINVPTKDSDFEFTPPAGTTIIRP